VINVRTGNPLIPCKITYVATIPDNAPVGPTILKLLPPNIAAISPAQMAVIIPTTGVAPEETAKDTDNGIEIKDTVRPDFKFFLIFSETIYIQ